MPEPRYCPYCGLESTFHDHGGHEVEEREVHADGRVFRIETHVHHHYCPDCDRTFATREEVSRIDVTDEHDPLG